MLGLGVMAMDTIKGGRHFILYEQAKSLPALQHSLSEWSDQLVYLTKLGDPAFAFYTLFPVCFAINNQLGVKLLLGTVISEWLNLFLKW
jgi:hypothetical protein